MDNGLGPRLINLGSLRGWSYTAITDAEIVVVRIYKNGSIKIGRGVARGSSGPHLTADGRMYAVDLFELAKGACGWWSFRDPDDVTGEVGTTAAPILWIDAEPLPEIRPEWRTS
ncbi:MULTISPECIES: hypothetical protein [unclassified Cryobacterium]|uniref:hypothetical protein n=1 Tax=unclassified Cryobacterium TaxID=2649013 RepID=UPI002B229E68|nr:MULTISPECIES: hypothetical protein [Cryobacterium]MEB0303861.1 hypothetical protein [Cryobacterium sp. 10I1]